jgi:hypothetical protein
MTELLRGEAVPGPRRPARLRPHGEIGQRSRCELPARATQLHATEAAEQEYLDRLNTLTCASQPIANLFPYGTGIFVPP